jgi:serine/threonine-protein kinase RsbW
MSTSLQLDLPAEPASVPVARRQIEAHAQALGMSESRITDLKTIVSEACGNAVRYAYPDSEIPGGIRVRASCDGDELELEIRDDGAGLRPHPDTAKGLGLGLLLIGALSKSFRLESEAGRGTCLTVRVPLGEVA